MNRLTIIGNLTKDPELRTTPQGKSVCTFTVAVNRKKKVDGQSDADFFRVSAWNAQAEVCQKFLCKGKKVCVVGAVSVSTYTGNDGITRSNLEVMAQEVEFISPVNVDQKSGMQRVEAPDDMPY